MNKYRVKTEKGYYYTEGTGRYGRFDGKALYAEILCQEHADKIVQWFNSLAQLPEQQDGEYYFASLEQFAGHAQCAACQREGRKPCQQD